MAPKDKGNPPARESEVKRRKRGTEDIDAADRWRQDHGYPVPSDDAGYVALVERTLLR